MENVTTTVIAVKMGSDTCYTCRVNVSAGSAAIAPAIGPMPYVFGGELGRGSLLAQAGMALSESDTGFSQP